VCRLKRELYGLKQAPHAFYTKIDSYLTNLGFIKSEADTNLYHILVEDQLLIIYTSSPEVASSFLELVARGVSMGLKISM